MKACLACGGEQRVFFVAEKMPVHQHMVMPSREEALGCARADLAIGVCDKCGFVSNLAFDPSLLRYSGHYDNSQSFSQAFASYLDDLARYLIEAHDIRGKDVIEIGCGKAEFLSFLCDIGSNTGIGFDPSFRKEHKTSDRVKVVSDYYSERYAHYKGDLVVARHVLEHVQDPREFVRMIRSSLADGPRSVVFIEVPSITWILQNHTFWDLFYEHCSYFSRGSLARLFSTSGFDVISATERFGEQYVWLEARPTEAKCGRSPAGLDQPADVVRAAADFAEGYARRLNDVRNAITRRLEEGQRCVVWGAGAKGVTLLNSLGLTFEDIPYVVDVNPAKQGAYLAGTGQSIIPPEELAADATDVIVVMNPNYLEEIRTMARSLALGAEVVAI